MTVQSSDVERALGSSELTTSDIDAFINAAGRLYDDLISDDSVGSDRRDDVVTRLAAHLIATGPERQISSGDGISFEGDTGEGLQATTHGQIAITLDPTGKLTTSSKPAPSVATYDVKDTDSYE